MKAMILRQTAPLSVQLRPLSLVEMGTAEPVANDLLIQVSARGVCQTELDEHCLSTNRSSRIGGKGIHVVVRPPSFDCILVQNE
ncbi:hypothetical protein [Rhodopirellula islandica]|nr:hypothetical protein [Rhodopirellula islandica]